MKHAKGSRIQLYSQLTPSCIIHCTATNADELELWNSHALDTLWEGVGEKRAIRCSKLEETAILNII